MNPAARLTSGRRALAAAGTALLIACGLPFAWTMTSSAHAGDRSTLTSSDGRASSLIEASWIRPLSPAEIVYEPPPRTLPDGTPRPLPGPWGVPELDPAYRPSQHPAPILSSAALPTPFGRGDAYTLPAVCHSLAAADFNGDGLTDLAAALSDAGLQVALQSSPGSLAWSEVASEKIWWVIATHLDDDSNVDLAALRYDESNVLAVYPGRGDGTFEAPVLHPVGSYPWTIAAGDLNLDGLADLVVTNSGDSTLAVFLNGPSGFSTPVLVPSAHWTGEVEIGDIDRDGALDLVVARASGQTVSVHPGRGDGSFEPPLHYPTSRLIDSIELADLDGDGWIDVAGAGDRSTINVFWNHSGELSERHAYEVRGNAWSGTMAIGDFDGDGRSDFVAGSYRSNQAESRANLFVQRPDRTFDGTLSYFTTPEHYLSIGTAEPVAVLLADLTGDGSRDLIVSQRLGDGASSAGEIVLIRHREALAFDGMADQALPPTEPEYSTWVQIQWVDFAGTGRPQLMVDRNSVCLLMTPRMDGTLAMSGSLPEGHLARAVDVDRDGRTDLVTQRGDTLTIRRTGEDGIPGLPTDYPGGTLYALGDFNGDGAFDLMIRSALDDTLRVRLAESPGTFGPLASTRLEAPSTYESPGTAGFLDADAKSDLVIGVRTLTASVPDSVATFRCENESTFTWIGTYPLIARAPKTGYARLDVIETLDVNGDGHADVMTLARVHAGSGQVSVLLGAGDGTLGGPIGTVLIGEDPQYVVGDLDGDGRPDIASGGYSGVGIGRVAIALNRGDGSFDVSTLVSTNYPRSLVQSDLDGDGQSELVIGCRGYSGSVMVLFNRTLNLPTASLQIALLDARYEADRVKLTWQGSEGVHGPATLERRVDAGAWTPLGAVLPDAAGRYACEDRFTVPGARQAYRLVIESTRELVSQVAEVSIPRRVLAVTHLGPNPTRGALRLTVSLAEPTPATLEVWDLAGRRVHAEAVEGLLAPRAITFASLERASPGIYWLRLAQNGTAVVRKVVVAR